jgi:hypothetical protein
MRVLISWLAGSFLLVASVSGAPLTYHIGPLILESVPGIPSPEEYIVTGTITTNGMIGVLQSTDFLSWSISVEGPRSYTFHPSNPGATLLVGTLPGANSVVASATEITAYGQFGDFFVRAYDNTVPNCTNCQQSLKWSGWGPAFLDYLHYDNGGSDDGPYFRPARASVPSNPALDHGAIVATRVVPEPACWLSAVVGAALLAIVSGPRR